ncbi:rRNA biogenesis protein rrp-36 [Ceratocystis fimbriata CBS 114723]|uniref:rRNA biogenesis protein RRP36 n=1 Tax=Ceratocystis fimbriata CBS 114723 TaxID=1035309 RepID=A0A2C5XKB0_9PEZI|nr:rRNA biogenesis protein rrp-36 [Ceratocystis fimbriata CBS 114723]
MALGKRKASNFSTPRRVRARKHEQEDPDHSDSSDAPSEKQISNLDSGEDSNVEDGDEEVVNYDSDADLPIIAPQSAAASLASVSFGDLAKAQKALGKTQRKEKRKAERAATPSASTKSTPSPFTTTAPAKKIAQSKADLQKRSSKHAPQEMSSKRPVSRKRDFGVSNKPTARDPRFDPLTGEVNETLIRKAYGFLKDYRASEIVDLKARVRKAKTEEERAELKRELLVLESKRKTEERKEHQQSVIDEHKRKEKELVAQGKKPYYLKQAELKKQVLVDRFKSMKKRDVDKAIMRKRKKVAGKEKKEMAQMERIDGNTRRGW